MAQAGYTPIQLYFSTTVAAVPVNTNLADGELAINITDGKLYYKDNGGTVRLLASNATSAPVLSFSAGTTGFTPSTATSGAITLAGTLATTNGGTGLTSFTSGGVVYASSTSALATGSALSFDGTKLTVIGSAPNQTNFVVTATGSDLFKIQPQAPGTGVYLQSSDYAQTVYAPMGFYGTSYQFNVGNVGIGVTPSVFTSTIKALQIGPTSVFRAGDTAYTQATFVASNARQETAVDYYIANGFATQYTQQGGAHIWATAVSGTAGNAIAFSQKMFLGVNGNLGIGTTSPATTLNVSGATGQTIMISNTSTSLSTGGSMGNLDFAAGTANTTNARVSGLVVGTSEAGGDLVVETRPDGGSLSERLRIASTGAFGLSGANYGTSGQVLTSGGSGAAPTWTTVGGGGGTPGGSNTQVQFNNSGSFGGSANFTFNGTGITTGNVNVTSSTAPTAGMYYNSTATSGLSFYNTGASGGSSAMQIYYGRSTMSATTGGISNPDSQWYAFGTGQTPSLTIGSTASLYYFTGHSYRLDEVPYMFRIRGSGRGDNGSYTVPESNGILFIDTADDYGGNASEGRNCIYVNNRATGFGSSTNGVKVINNSYARQNAFYALLKIGDPNGGGQNFGYYAQIDTSTGPNDNAAPVGLVIDNALVNNYTKTNGGAQLAIFYDRRDGSTARTAIQFYRNTTSNSVGTITTTNTATAYNTSSDYRLKENIAPLTGAIEKVLRLKPSTYTWKVDGSAGEGFIAHELQEVIPQAVSGEKDAEKLQQVEVEHAVPEVQDADGNIISHGKAPVYEERMMPVYQGVDSSFLVATLTAAIQEQQALIVALTARVEALEAK